MSERLSELRNELLLQTGRFFPLTDGEYEALKESIRLHGIQMPIIIGEHIALIDGRHRCLAHQDLQLDTPIPALFTEGLTADDEHALAISLNAARRQLTRQQKRLLVTSELHRDPARSNGYIAAVCGVTHPFVASVRAEIAQQQHAELEAGHAPQPLEYDPLRDPDAHIDAPRADEYHRVPVDPPERIGQDGSIHHPPPILPRNERRDPERKLGYATCAHGQTHLIIQIRAGDYRLTIDDNQTTEP